MLSFIESNQSRKPPKPNPNFNPWHLFLTGLSLILGYTTILIPFGAYFTFSVSVWIILILFLPLLFLAISLISRFGYVILISVFLSLLDGGASLLFLGDFFGYLTKTTVASNILPDQASSFTLKKYIFLSDFEIQVEKGGSFQAPITVRARGGSKIYGPMLQFRFAPIVAKSNPNKQLPLYALCYANLNETCDFSKETSGGIVIRETIWDSNKVNVVGSVPLENSIFLMWIGRGESDISRKGLISFGAILTSVLVWVGICFLRKIHPKN